MYEEQGLREQYQQTLREQRRELERLLGRQP